MVKVCSSTGMRYGDAGIWRRHKIGGMLLESSCLPRLRADSGLEALGADSELETLAEAAHAEPLDKSPNHITSHMIRVPS